MTKVDDGLAGVTRLGVDTPAVIYFIEANPTYDHIVTNIFQRISNAALLGITSTITLAEVLVQPIRRRDAGLVLQYSELLTRSDNFRMLSIDREIAERAADIRATYNIRIPDAVQLGAALSAGCEAFLTNDYDLRRVTTLRILLLDELEL